jgi:uncharacterized protein (DUF697 family)
VSPASTALVVTIPATPAQIASAADRCRSLVRKQALLAAGVSMVPVPGLDWVTDIGVLIRLIPQINEAFGLSQSQIERLAPDRQLVVYKALMTSGGMLVGRVVTRELVIKALRLVGIRLSTQQAAKFVPIAGQAVSAALTYTALRYVCEQHIRQCIAVAHEVAQPTQPLEYAQRVDD